MPSNGIRVASELLLGGYLLRRIRIWVGVFLCQSSLMRLALFPSTENVQAFYFIIDQTSSFVPLEVYILITRPHIVPLQLDCSKFLSLTHTQSILRRHVS